MAEGYLDTQNLSQCCGCGACADICPKDAIRMETGPDKAIYPRITEAACIHCNLCRSVCPMEKSPQLEDNHLRKVFALTHNNEEKRKESASGGAFEVISQGLSSQYPDLMVAGAAWDTVKTVRHILLPAQERAVFKKSKYVQSDCSGIYQAVKETLKKDIHVLFAGTPCQVAALRKYLGREQENLFTLDLICRGVPGAPILEAYIRELEEKHQSKVAAVSFREKRKDLYGEIHSDHVRVQLENGKQIWKNGKTDAYLRGYHKSLFCRESCYSCPYASPERMGDITIGDFWNIQSQFPDKVDYTGVSGIQVNSLKGQRMISLCSDAWIAETDPKLLSGRNGRLRFPTKKHPRKEQFLAELDGKAFSVLIDQYVGKADYLDNMLSGLLPGQLKRWIKNKGYKKWKKR